MSTTDTTNTAAIGYRLARLRKDLGTTQAELAVRLDVSRSYIADIESGRTLPSRNFLEVLVDRTAANAEWLLLGEGERLRPDVVAWDLFREAQRTYEFMRGSKVVTGDLPTPAKPVEPDLPSPVSAEEHVYQAMRRLDAIIESQASAEALTLRPLGAGRTTGISVQVRGQSFKVQPDDYRFIPFYDVTVAAGGGRVVDFDAAPSKFNAYRKDFLQEQGLLDAELFDAVVVGDSMFPEIRDGELITVNASDKVVVSGEIYVLRIRDEFISKYLRRLPPDVIEIYSENSAKYPPIQIREAELDNGVEIIGRVVRRSQRPSRT